MRIRAPLLSLTLLGCGLPSAAWASPAPASGIVPAVSAAPAPSSNEDVAARKAACDELAAAIITGNDTGEQVDRMLAALLDQLDASDPNFKLMEAAYPGLKQAVAVGVKPVLLRHMATMLPAYRADLARLYFDNLSTEEAQDAATFFRRDDVRGFVSNLNHANDFKSISQQAVSAKTITADAVNADLGAAGVRAVRELPPGQREAILAFFAGPIGAKLVSLSPRKAQIDAKWSNYAPPALVAELMQAMGRAMVDHVGKNDPEAAKRIEAEFVRSGLMGN